MKNKTMIILGLIVGVFCQLGAQDQRKDIWALEQKIAVAPAGEQIYLLCELSKLYWGMNPAKSIDLAQKALELAKKQKHAQMETVALRLLGSAYKNIGEYDQAMDFFLQSLRLAQKHDFKRELADVYNNLAILENARGNLELSIKQYQAAVEIYQLLGDRKAAAVPLGNIGILFSKMGLYDKALDYYWQALTIRQEYKDLAGTANSYNLIASVHLNRKQYEKALEFAIYALRLRESIGNTGDLSKSYQTLSEIYKEKKEYEKSLQYAEKSAAIKEKLGDLNGQLITLSNMGETYYLLKKYQISLKYLKKSQKIARQLKSNSLLGDIYLKLSRSYAAIGDVGQAYWYLQKYQSYQEEFVQMNLRKIALYEEEKKEKELKLVKQSSLLQAEQMKTQFVVILGLMVLVLVAGVFGYFILVEKKKSERLLLNILPGEVAKDLKHRGFSVPQKFEQVTVFFSDMVNFTKISESLEASVLIHELSSVFTVFDQIMEKYQCERIKTIGDAYLAVCGMPTANTQHASNMLKAAVEIIDFLEQRNASAQVKWQVRIGLHSGPLVGGIVGTKKYIYDIFGDTVNTASRMEHHGQAMRINVSQETYELLKEQYSFIAREKEEVKGKGLRQMYFLSDPG